LNTSTLRPQDLRIVDAISQPPGRILGLAEEIQENLPRYFLQCKVGTAVMLSVVVVVPGGHKWERSADLGKVGMIGELLIVLSQCLFGRDE